MKPFEESKVVAFIIRPLLASSSHFDSLDYSDELLFYPEKIVDYLNRAAMGRARKSVFTLERSKGLYSLVAVVPNQTSRAKLGCKVYSEAQRDIS